MQAFLYSSKFWQQKPLAATWAGNTGNNAGESSAGEILGAGFHFLCNSRRPDYAIKIQSIGDAAAQTKF
jgi:hypothetical protein